MGDLSLAAGDLAGAQKLQQESLEAREKLGKDVMASSRVSLAELALEGGRAQEAESAVRAAIEEFRSEKDAEQELRARMILARSLLAQSRFREAEAEINQANSLVAASEYKAVL